MATITICSDFGAPHPAQNKVWHCFHCFLIYFPWSDGTRWSYLSIITLNVNGLNAPIKRQRLAEWIQKQDPIYAVYKRSTSKQGSHTDWKWRAGKRYSMQIETKRNQVAILISDKIDFKTKTVKRDKDLQLLLLPVSKAIGFWLSPLRKERHCLTWSLAWKTWLAEFSLTVQRLGIWVAPAWGDRNHHKCDVFCCAFLYMWSVTCLVEQLPVKRQQSLEAVTLLGM